MAFLNGRVAAMVALACLGSALGCGSVASAQTELTTENEVKAAFLYNFAKYVEWPATSFGTDDLFHICVIADAAFVKNVDAIVAGETIDGRMVVRDIPDNLETAHACHILFVARSEMDRSQRFLAAVHAAPVLTVGDAPDFLTRGGDIALIRDGSRVRFDVNVGHAQRNGLAISSRLLRVARRVSLPSPGR